MTTQTQLSRPETSNLTFLDKGKELISSISQKRKNYPTLSAIGFNEYLLRLALEKLEEIEEKKVGA